ncbi:nitrilase-related carbon-nitrogen hydrolase [Neobacillus niacini]|uniref:nitrilase-related carbon-nitrogen hydrolase n=1 Tax=Neobacillus niacini TaxID=86668 RepID=UPI003000CE23
MRKVNIGICQFESELGKPEVNFKKAEEFIKEASEKGADIICFPELFVTGYNFGILGDETVTLSKTFYELACEKFSKWAKQYQIYIIAPFGEVRENEEQIFNSALFFDKQGNLLGNYAKTHLWSAEKKYFKEGDTLPVYDTDFGKLGIIICYDAGFPEVARTLALRGAEIIFVPAAWRIEDKDMWDLNISQRALENICFTVGVNSVGNFKNLHLFGHSKVCNPRGHIINELTEKEELFMITVDLDEVEAYREQIDYMKDRRSDLYQL